MNVNLLSIEIRYEQDVVLTRQRARQIAHLLNFNSNEQTALATAVSELARNAFRYAGGGRVTFAITHSDTRPMLSVRVQDKGPGIENLQAILAGHYRSEAGMGLGLLGAQRLNDDFDIQTAPGAGTTVTIGKWLPKRAQPVTPELVSELAGSLAQWSPRGPLQEVQEQNKELLQAMADLRTRQAEVERLNAELAETNRGVVALYAELDEKAESLRRASEYKSRFLSDMTHELRTPLNAMISLSRLLLDRLDGELTNEQEKQVGHIHKSATSLGEMVNDLLDLARIEAGKTDVHVSSFSVADLLAALRGMFRPLANDLRVTLLIEEPIGLPVLTTDERKLTQILRNLISNALKFTEAGEVRVRAESDGQPGAGASALFTVTDTGIGIAPADLGRIFDDFTQIESGAQGRHRGTGLGLPLTRKLARLLGGDVSVTSAPGAGSTFLVRFPAELSAGADGPVSPNDVNTQALAGESRG